MPRKKTRKRTKSGEIPNILHFKPRNLAYILIDGNKKYLGHYDGKTISESVQAERLRVWAEYQAKLKIDPEMITPDQVTVAVLVDSFYQWAAKTYVKNGRSTGSAERVLTACRELLQLYAALPAIKFTQRCLRAY